MKKPEGKPDPGLFYSSALYETVRVRAFGIEKHGSAEGWKTTKPIQHYNAAIRHIRAVIDGEVHDQESGFNHLAHAICDCMFEIERMKNEENKQTMCAICGKNPVDVSQGIDTCDICLGKE